jgi:hypothetical protein
MSPLAERADRSIVTSIYEQFRQPDDPAGRGSRPDLLIYLLPGNFDRSSAKLRSCGVRASPTSPHAATRGSHPLAHHATGDSAGVKGG